MRREICRCNLGTCIGLLVISLAGLRYITNQRGSRYQVGCDKGFPEQGNKLSQHDRTYSEFSVYKNRYNSLMTACSRQHIREVKAKEAENAVRNHFFVDRKNKLVYCGIEKVGCTFWKRVLLITTGVRSERNPYDIPTSGAHSHKLESFRGMRFDDILDVISSYRKFVFVRDPYTRLFSCFVDKIFSPNSGYFGFRRKIVRQTRPDSAGKSDIGCAPHVTFSEFVKVVIRSLQTGKGMDGHFVPMSDHCRPCQIKFDFIGKMENFSQDAEYLIRTWLPEGLVNLSVSQESTEKDAIIDKVKFLYSSRKDIEKCMPFSHAIKLAWRTFQIRGILDRDKSLPEKFITDTDLKSSDLTEAVLEASKMSDPKSKAANRREAVLEAFGSVHPADMRQLRKLYGQDFEVFGYDMYPSDMVLYSATNAKFLS